MRTQYVRSSDGVSIAYQTFGEETPTQIFVPGALSNLLFADVDPSGARFWERVGRFCRVVRFDKRGTGLSDRSAAASTIEDQVSDVEAVRSAIASDRFALNGLSQGAAVSVLYAVAHPERVTHLILTEGVCCDAKDPDAPASRAEPLINWDEFFRDVEDDFEGFSGRFAEIMFPGDSDFVGSAADFLRATASPQSLRSLWSAIIGLDLRPLLKDVKAPTLILHARGDRHHPVEHGRYFAKHIPDSRYVELDTDTHVPSFDNRVAPTVLAAIEEFLTGSVCHTADRRFASILFSDIVGSTKLQKERGDRAWRDILAAYEAAMRRIVEQYTGRVVKFQGDGFMATFPSAGEALRAARAALTSATADLGIQARGGIHAGELYEVEGDVFGTCVNIAARVCDHAEPGQVLTTSVVEALVEGSDLRFDDRGETELKGAGKRRLVCLL